MSFLKKEVTLPKSISLPKLKAPKVGTPKTPKDQAPAALTVDTATAATSEAPTPLKVAAPEASKRKAPQVGRMRSHRGRTSAPRSSGITGLEIGAMQLIAAEGRLSDGRIVAQRAAVRSIPAGLVRDGLVVDSAALTSELKAMFAENRLGRRVRVGLATPRTILRVIDLPPLDEKDIKTVLPMQAQERIPMPLDRAVMDHQIVGLVDTPEGQRLRAVVVATEREPVETLLAVLKGAGLRAEGIDLSIFAAMRAVTPEQEMPGPVLYAQLGDLVNLAIADGGVCQFTRQAPQGLAYVLGELANLRDITLDEAHALLLSAAGEDSDADRADVAQIGALLGRVAGELGGELRAAAEFYGIQSGATVTRGVVTGALAPLRGFVPALAEASGLSLTCGEAAVSEDAALGELDPRVAPVAVGLSVGSVNR